MHASMGDYKVIKGKSELPAGEKKLVSQSASCSNET